MTTSAEVLKWCGIQLKEIWWRRNDISKIIVVMALIFHDKLNLEQCKVSYTIIESVIHSIDVKSIVNSIDVKFIVNANLTAANTARVSLANEH